MGRMSLTLATGGSLALVLFSGCAPVTQLNDAQAQGRALMSQNRAQLAEIENLRTHSRRLENQLGQTEEQLALLEDEIANERSLRGNIDRERAVVNEQLAGLAQGRPPLSPARRKQLEDLSRRFPSLKFDPVSGIAKLDTDVMFDSGQADLKPGAAGMLEQLASELKRAGANDLKVMVVGHTDDRGVARRMARDAHPTNFHLSTARALSVAECLRGAGLAEHQLGVAGFAAREPLTPNASAYDRQRNRRVEVFVMASDVPIVGWTDSTPTMH